MTMQPIEIFNTLTRKKEKFTPLNSPFVGMYVCGPTVYNDVHLGNCRTFISFDLIYRYLIHAGYKVRYVRNITDAGHLEGDRDEGEDKFSKKAKLEQVEPMEIVQKYTLSFHEVMRMFNTLPPNIEPTATGHISEQIEMTKQIIESGFGYVVNGTVYFDVEKYSEKNNYGLLSNRKTEELLESTRELEGQDEKKGRLDFALWIKAKPEHIMRWPSPWGWGFPGWHIECSAMSTKYLGTTFDIHGGGMDLIATHHTNEIAQSQACNHCEPVKYWMHTNMLTVNGVRMSKSAGNGFLPMELFAGNHKLLEKRYSPMVVRFFMMQTHYRSTLDFSNEALQASEKGFKKIINGLITIKAIKHFEQKEIYDETLNKKIEYLCSLCYEGMNDDFNSAIVIANLFNLLKYINSFHHKIMNIGSLSAKTFALMQTTYISFVEDVLGLKEEKSHNPNIIDDLLSVLLEMYKNAKEFKDYKTVDLIRAKVKKEGIVIKDTKDGAEWNYEE
ncbi:MAG: cysteine--tRNA ligase [Bacteroidota bacterium]